MARRSAKTLPMMRTSSFDYNASKIQDMKKVVARPKSREKRINIGQRSSDESSNFSDAPVYQSMQNLVQRMLHSEHGVPIKSHKKRLISAIPSAFTGADIVNWLTKNLSIQSKAESVHLANLLCRHGYLFCVESVNTQVKDDGTLFRFQTPYYWPSQKPDVSDFEYGVYLVKQVLRSKHRIRLLDYELNNLHKLKLRLAKEWKAITGRAEDDVKVFREQKRVAKTIMSSQEEAFWRLHKPPPGESSVQDSALTRQCTERFEPKSKEWTEDSLKNELTLLKESTKRTRVKVSTAVENMWNFSSKYEEFDPMLTPPMPSNPWITGEDTLWTVEKSLIEHPSERQVKKWACSFHDLLADVTGRFKFEQYCKSQFNIENVRFWQACRDLKSLPLVAIEGSVQLVYDEFLQRGAVSEVNVSADVQEEVEKDLKDPSRYAFSAAQAQIFRLMQNDIYPRFLKSKEFQGYLRRGREVDDAGKGFFAKLQKKKFEGVLQDASGISPCLPQRYTKRQLSISRKMSSPGGSSSLDNIFLACGGPVGGGGGGGGSGGAPNTSTNMFGVEDKRSSAYTEAFIDALVSPNPNKVLDAPDMRVRRVSAPEPSDIDIVQQQKFLGEQAAALDNIHEDKLPPLGFEYNCGGMDSNMPMSYSADDLQQLMEDADTIGPSKWKKFGLAAGIDFTEPLSSGHNTSQRHSITDPTASFLSKPLLCLPQSPEHGVTSTFGMEPSRNSGGLFLHVSNESIHSATSH